MSGGGILTARRALGVAVAALGVWALVIVFRPEPPPPLPRAFTSSQQCQSCHAEAFSEWSSSWHAQAWTDPEVRTLSNDFANTDCIDCHAPRPVFETGVGQRVLPRSARRSEGVDCIACHLLPESAPEAKRGAIVAGTIDDDSAPCRPAAVRDLGSPDYCASCHDQHKTVQQWKESKWAAQGMNCVSCHMPYRGGDASRGRDHTMHGGHDIELVKSAVVLRGRREGDRWIAEVENVGAGHSFPTDERSRAADVFWRPLQAEGGAPAAWRHAYRFRDPYRHEVDLVSTLLAAHATQAITIEGADAAGGVEVAIFYKRKPYWTDPEHPDPDKEAELLHRIELRP
jgi:hypothetical protein